MNDVQLIGENLFVSFSYDADKVAAVKAIASAHGYRPGQCYDGATKTWKLPKRCAADVAKVFFDLTWCERMRDYMRRSKAKFETADTVLAGHRQHELQLHAEQARTTGFALDAALPDGRTPRIHQREGTLQMMRLMRLILGWEMGTGKTLAALLVGKMLYEREGWHTLVICRANLCENWRREASGCGHRIVSVFAHAKIPETHSAPFILVNDEAHDFQSMKSQRTKKMLKLALSPLCHGVINISGTPMPNGQPKNIFPLLRACKHHLGADQDAFEKRYCAAGLRVFGKAYLSANDTRINWKCKGCAHDNVQNYRRGFRVFKCAACGRQADFKVFPDSGGCSNMEELHAKIAPILMLKKKSECLDLPPKTRIVERVEVSEEMEAHYRRVLSEAKEQYRQRVRDGSIEKDGEALALLTFVRMAAAQAKIAHVLERVREINEQGSKCVIFSAFKEPVIQIARELKLAAAYTGDLVRQQEKQRLIDEFQAGRAQNFASTIKAGGVGITLTAADYVITIDRELRPGDNDQAEDRLHRDGQKNAVTSIWLSAFAVDDKIDDMNAEKEKNIAAVIEGKSGGTTDRLSAQSVLHELFK